MARIAAIGKDTNMSAHTVITRVEPVFTTARRVNQSLTASMEIPQNDPQKLARHPKAPTNSLPVRNAG
jgi:hypothetical protein